MSQHPIVSQALRARTIADTYRLLEDAGNWFGIRLPRPEIRFDLRGQSAGQARLCLSGDCVIRYNPALLGSNPDRFLAETVAHEVAHLVAYRLHGRGIRPHGPEWQTIMRRYGAEPSRCHSYDLSAAQHRSLRQFRYHCHCREHDLSSIRHNRVLKGRTYYCRRCKTALFHGPRPAGGES